MHENTKCNLKCKTIKTAILLYINIIYLYSKCNILKIDTQILMEISLAKRDQEIGLGSEVNNLEKMSTHSAALLKS